MFMSARQPPRISVVIPARNEADRIEETVAALKAQTLPINQIIVVDDGSTDTTAEIATNLGCEVVRLPYHEKSYVGRPELVPVFNAGLQRIKDCTHILIVGADHRLPQEYVETIVQRMQANPKLAIASGKIRGEPCTESTPRGSGRIVRCDFWKKANNLQYPLGWGWEGWLIFKAMQMGFESKCFPDVVTEIDRPTRMDAKKARLAGRGLYALGYHWLNVLYLTITTFRRSPKAAWNLFWNWLTHHGVERYAIAEWVNQMQKQRFKARLRQAEFRSLDNKGI